MAVLVRATFDGATSGDATTATTGADATFGPAVWRQHTTVQKINGASVYFNADAASGGSFLRWNLPDTAKVFTRLYVRRENLPTANAAFAELRNTASVQVCRILIVANTGALGVRNGATVVANYPLAADQWYRVDWSAEVGVGQSVRLYTGSTLHSANTADAVAGGALLAGPSAALRYLDVGSTATTTPPLMWYADELMVDDAVMPPPWSPSGRRLERKVAGAWAPQIVEKKVAGAWVPQIVERKDAGVWS